MSINHHGYLIQRGFFSSIYLILCTLQMSLYSCSTMSSSKSNDSYRLSSSSLLSSITTVSSQINKEEWPAPPEEVIQSEQNMVSNAWQIEKNVSRK